MAIRFIATQLRRSARAASEGPSGVRTGDGLVCALRVHVSNETESEGLATARQAGLRYTSDDEPGLGRKRKGRGFAYVARNGKPLRDERELRRIRALAIPPAWTEV